MATTTQTINWPGQSGKLYSYHVYPIGTKFDAVPGNYIFAKMVSGRWSPVYVGETSDLSERFDNHHKMPCIKRIGATHIHAHRNSGGTNARRAEESDLVRNFKPACNS